MHHWSKRIANVLVALLLLVVLVVAFVPALIQFCLQWAQEKSR